MGEQLSQDAIMELVRQQYPELLAVLSKPGVQDAVFQAVQNNWSAPRLQAALQATPYYQQTAANQRSYDILVAIDPTTANQRSQQYQQKFNDLINQTGINPYAVSGALADKIFHAAIVNQWTDTDFKNNLVEWTMADPGAAAAIVNPSGEVASQIQTVLKAASDYGVPISTQAANQWAGQLTSGAVNQTALNGYLVQQAKSMYANDPNLSQALDAGQTTTQYASPYQQVAVKELNINPGDFNLSDPKWQAALSSVDPSTGNKVPLSLDQWQTTLRTDPKYGYDQTQNGQAAAASLTTALAQKMGAL